MKSTALNIHRRAARSLLALGLFVAAGNVWAGCTSDLPGGGTSIIGLSGFRVEFPRDLPINGIIRTITVPVNNGGSPIFTCDGPPGDLTFIGTTGVLSSSSTYLTTIPGLGLRITFFQDGGYTRNLPYAVIDFQTPRFQWQIRRFEFAFIKLADIDTPGEITGEVMRADIPDHNFKMFSVVLESPIVIVPNTPTCVVNAPDITLDIGSVDGRALKSNGVSPPSPAQNIQLNCTGGSPGVEASVYMVMTDASNGANTTDRLPTHNEGGDPIPGLGVQLLRQDGAPIVFGPDSAADDAPGQWKAGSTPNNPAYQIPIRARYVYSGTADIPGGTAGAAATFTMNYH